MSDLIDLEDAARFLGISPEELVEHRSRGDISGLRSGSSWKFKRNELDRFKQNLADSADEPTLDASLDDDFTISLDDDLASPTLTSGSGIVPTAATPSPVASDDALEFSLDDDDLSDLSLETADEDSAESVLVSENELGRSDDSTASTIIGQLDGVHASDSDLDLGRTREPADELLLASASDVQLASPSDVLSGEPTLDALGSDLTLDAPTSASGIDLGSDDLDGELQLDLDLPANSSGASSLRLAGDQPIESPPPPPPAAPAKPTLSATDDDDDAEMRLEGDDGVLDLGGSDVTLDASESGINLGQPSDSGLSLEDAMLELDAKGDGGLGGDDMLMLEDDNEGSSDDEFLLTPVEDSGMLEEEGSGSQVIELEEDLSGSHGDDAIEMLEDEALEIDEDDSGLDAVGPAVAGAAAPLIAGATDSSDSEYSLFNVLMLFSIAGLMLIGSLMISDIIRSMWAWREPFTVTSSMMEMITSSLGG